MLWFAQFSKVMANLYVLLNKWEDTGICHHKPHFYSTKFFFDFWIYPSLQCDHMTGKFPKLTSSQVALLCVLQQCHLQGQITALASFLAGKWQRREESILLFTCHYDSPPSTDAISTQKSSQRDSYVWKQVFLFEEKLSIPFRLRCTSIKAVWSPLFLANAFQMCPSSSFHWCCSSYNGLWSFSHKTTALKHLYPPHDLGISSGFLCSTSSVDPFFIYSVHSSDWYSNCQPQFCPTFY